MDMKTVQSSLIESVGYEAENKTLCIKFKRGGVYNYDEVPPEIYDEIMKTNSPGSFFHKNIKGKFAYEKIS